MFLLSQMAKLHFGCVEEIFIEMEQIIAEEHTVNEWFSWNYNFQKMPAKMADLFFITVVDMRQITHVNIILIYVKPPHVMSSERLEI